MTGQSEFGIPKLVLQLATIWRDTLPCLVDSVTHSPDRRHIISTTNDLSVKLFGPETNNPSLRPLIEHAADVQSVTYSPSPQQTIAVPHHDTSGAPNPLISPPVDVPHCDTIHTIFYVQPDPEGWVRDPIGGLLYWVPPDCRRGLHSPALLTIPCDYRGLLWQLCLWDFLGPYFQQ